VTLNDKCCTRVKARVTREGRAARARRTARKRTARRARPEKATLHMTLHTRDPTNSAMNQGMSHEQCGVPVARSPSRSPIYLTESEPRHTCSGERECFVPKYFGA
jgi:hypothetical protein